MIPSPPRTQTVARHLTDEPHPASRLVVGRQAITDASGDAIGYELLFRTVDGEGPAQSKLSGDEMTNEVLYGALNIGLRYLVGSKLVFCNADRGLLVEAMPITLPPASTVIEILETVMPEREVLEGCHRLRRRGYEFALDDFTWFEGAEEFLELASYVKIDVQAVRGNDLSVLIDKIRPYTVCLLAEKVEDATELPRLKRLGFDLFQGYAIERPKIMSRRVLEPSTLARIKLAATLAGDEVDLDELERILRGEPGLTHQVLQLAATGQLGGMLRNVGTIRQAVVLLGTRRIQGWIALLLAHSVGASSYDTLLTVLIRARACELLSVLVPSVSSQTAFAAGMISAFDVLLDVPAEELASTLPLTDELREGAFGSTSPLAEIVRDVIDYQTGSPTLPPMLSNIASADFDVAFASAFAWAVSHAATVE